MTNDLERLLTAAKKAAISPQESYEQRESFAYGNAKIENDLISREMIREAAQRRAAK